MFRRTLKVEVFTEWLVGIQQSSIISIVYNHAAFFLVKSLPCLFTLHRLRCLWEMILITNVFTFKPAAHELTNRMSVRARPLSIEKSFLSKGKLPYVLISWWWHKKKAFRLYVKYIPGSNGIHLHNEFYTELQMWLDSFSTTVSTKEIKIECIRSPKDPLDSLRRNWEQQNCGWLFGQFSAGWNPGISLVRITLSKL